MAFYEDGAERLLSVEPVQSAPKVSGAVNPGSGNSRDGYARLAFRLYRALIDTHLGSGKASRAAPAAHYGAILAELSSLLGEPALWTDFLGHLRRAHERKRLIWQRLRAEGCPVD